MTELSERQLKLVRRFREAVTTGRVVPVTEERAMAWVGRVADWGMRFRPVRGPQDAADGRARAKRVAESIVQLALHDRAEDVAEGFDGGAPFSLGALLYVDNTPESKETMALLERARLAFLVVEQGDVRSWALTWPRHSSEVRDRFDAKDRRRLRKQGLRVRQSRDRPAD